MGRPAAVAESGRGGDGPAVALYSKFGAGEDVLHFDIPPHRGGAASAEPGGAADAGPISR